jgi:predicted porin
VKYPQLGDGHDGIRNFGFGAHYKLGDVLAMLLYTNTKNTATGAEIDVYKTGAQWDIAGPWSAGLDYTFMQGNETLDNNRAQQVSGVLQYHLSKRTFICAEAIYQRASGDGAVTQAWIDSLADPASDQSQTLARIGVSMRF